MFREDQAKRKLRRDLTLAQMQRLPLNAGPVLAVMETDGSCPDELIKVLEQSPVLAARVVGVANSAGSSAIHRMDSIGRCVRHLGGKHTRTIALTMALQLMIDELDVDQDLVRKLWGSASTKAVTAKLVAEAVSPEQADKAYTLGLLQDIALPVLLAVDEHYFKRKLVGTSGKSEWLELERAHFGIDHAELGAVLLQNLGAPPELVKQVYRHHDPLNDDDMAWVAEMPTRFSGLLPHLDEKPTQEQATTLSAVHTRFLASSFESLDVLTEQVRSRVKALGEAAGGSTQLPKDFASELIASVTGDTFELAAQVGRLDRQLAHQIDRLATSQEEALSDTLTGLLNRRGFEAMGQQMLAHAAKAKLSAACLMIDLDDFKPINDTFGHAAGDHVLQTAAKFLKANVASGDLVARIGGDEFAILVLGDRQDDAQELAQRLHTVCNGRAIQLVGEDEAKLAMSIGGVFFDHVTNQTMTEDIIGAADQVMYGIKHAGKAGLKFEEMDQNKAA